MRKRLTVRLDILIVLTLILFGGNGAAAGEPLVIGHRGAAGLAPENTIAAFGRALSLGVDAIEMDVLLTADDVPVVHHDPRLKPETTRTGDGRWLFDRGPAIRTLPLSEVKKYDVGRLKPGTRYARRYPDQQPADGETIPTLGEVFALAGRMGKRTVQFWIEIKTSPESPDLTAPPEAVADAVVRLADEAVVTGRVVLLSFDWRALVHARQVAPDVPTSFLSAEFGGFNTVHRGRPGASPWLAGFDIDDFAGSLPRTVHAAGGHVWSPHFRHVSPGEMAEAHRLGLGVVLWTVNEASDMRRFIDMGVDGITTDRPDILLEILAGK